MEAIFGPRPKPSYDDSGSGACTYIAFGSGIAAGVLSGGVVTILTIGGAGAGLGDLTDMCQATVPSDQTARKSGLRRLRGESRASVTITVLAAVVAVAAVILILSEAVGSSGWLIAAGVLWLLVLVRYLSEKWEAK